MNCQISDDIVDKFQELSKNDTLIQVLFERQNYLQVHLYDDVTNPYTIYGKDIMLATRYNTAVNNIKRLLHTNS